MNATQDPQSVRGALQFVADLSAAAAECEIARDSDELTARRRRRETAGSDELAREDRGVKAL